MAMTEQARLQTIPIECLVRNRAQPRQHFAADELQALAASIKSTHGLLQPHSRASIARGAI